MGAVGSAAAAPSTTEPATPATGGDLYVFRHPYCRYVGITRTVVGIVTVVLLWFFGVNLLIPPGDVLLGVVLLSIGVPTFLLEFGYFIRICFGHGGACCRFFSVILGFDGWKRAILYAIFAVPCFWPGFTNIKGIIAGLGLVATALLYLTKRFQVQKVKAGTMAESVQSVRTSIAVQTNGDN